MATIYVSGGGDALRTACNGATTGDTLLVSAGVYTYFSAAGKQLVIDGTEPGVVVDGGKTHPCANFGAITDPEQLSVIRYVTFRHGYASGNGGGVQGAKCVACLFFDCGCRWGGGAIAYGSAINCTFVGCYVGDPYGTGTGGSAIVYNSHICANCIFYGNWLPDPWNLQNSNIGTNPYTGNNCAYHTTVGKDGSTTVSDNISVGSNTLKLDPQFVDAEAGDYSLRITSPCRKAGAGERLDSAHDMVFSPWKNPPSIGCYEYVSARRLFLPSPLHPLGC